MTSLVQDRLPGDDTRRPSAGAATARRWIGRLAGPLLVVLVFGIWELYSRLRETPTYVLPRPSAIADAAWGDRSQLLSQLGQTLVEAAGGFALAAFVAISLAIAVQRSRTFELTVLPWIVVLQAVPVVAITPMLALIIGRNAFTAMVIAAIIALFPILVNTVRGLGSATDSSVELMHVFGASGWDTFRFLRVPSALPYTFAGLRVAASVVVPGAMVAEWITSDSGLGFYVINQTVAYQTELVWAGILVATLAGVAFFTLVTWIERRTIPWAETPIGAI
jgi:ABC-type nitrate/sulfonate/bicarbonate transport system permease component